ncbi:glycosyltransferase [Hahella sp. KA22]|uniref:glycosyltransferase family 4 protein n=1 Tax=Hahella sp. KA22 TaxID=1628392 RepID=UPI000FDE9C56|nr:glycosyltransferase family 4 protein [Hahella sp. KA22]AZZ91684.1 glycosyltransferase family 1 protein [Hahella sp. KA22]QAY55054.1 glycosyltransferase [Hahella sp. KA22]
MKKYRVVLCSNTSWYLFKFRKSTITSFLDKGAEVYCVAPPDEYSYKLSQLGANYVKVNMVGKSTKLISELKSALFIYNKIKSISPSHVFNFTPKMNLYSGLACRILKIPYSNNISGLGTMFIHDSILFRIARKAFKVSNGGADTVFFQNDEDRQLFDRMGLINGGRVDVLPGSGVNVNEFSFSELPKTDLVFLMIGRLIGDKGVREYVEAARIVKETNQNVRFLLAGPAGVSNQSAISESELEQWVSSGIVEYIGYQEDVKPWIKAAHVVVLPSYREGMPRVVLEAASMGRPAIVSDAPGCRQSIAPGETGLLCKPKDAGDLANVFFKVIDMDRAALENMGREARKRMVDYFSEEIVVKKALDCVGSVI